MAARNAELRPALSSLGRRLGTLIRRCLCRVGQERKISWPIVTVWASIFILLSLSSFAQDLAPRAYVITPTSSNALVFSNSFFKGKLVFNDVLPITDTTATINAPSLTIYHSFGFFGRSANVTATLPYGVGTFRGTVLGSGLETYRSGLVDSVYRISVNLYGGRSMNVKEFRSWKQKLIVGVSLRISAPTGQYDPKLLINPGQNRWGFKPEVGISRRWGKWIVDGYTGVWFYTENPKFFSENKYVSAIYRQTQKPILAFEGHLSYDVKPRAWVSFDANYWRGGVTSLNGLENPSSLQSNSRMGATISVPITKHQSVKASYNYGAYVRFGGNYHNVAAAWQYSWIGNPLKQK